MKSARRRTGPEESQQLAGKADNEISRVNEVQGGCMGD